MKIYANQKFPLFFLMLALLFSLNIHAFPRGCEVRGFAFDENFLVLNESGEQSFYLLQNRYNQQIDMVRIDTDNSFMTPKMEAHLDIENWAAFASDIQNVYFRCFLKNEEQETEVKCKDALDVCQYPRVKFALSNMGNYWVSINKTQTQVIKDAISKGILLRW